MAKILTRPIPELLGFLWFLLSRGDIKAKLELLLKIQCNYHVLVCLGLTNLMNAQKLPYEFYNLNEKQNEQSIQVRLANLYTTDVFRLLFSYYKEFRGYGFRYTTDNTLTKDYTKSRHIIILRRSILDNLSIGAGASLEHISSEESNISLTDPGLFANLSINATTDLQFFAFNLADQSLEGPLLSWSLSKSLSPQLSLKASLSGSIRSWPEFNACWYYQNTSPWSISLSINANPFYSGLGIFYNFEKLLVGTGTFYDFRLGSTPYVQWSTNSPLIFSRIPGK